jgi:predicted dehydrogenase
MEIPNENQVYKSVVVGLGSIGMQYDLKMTDELKIASLTSALKYHPKFNLVGGIDICENRREIFENKFKQPAFSSIEEAKKIINPEIVVIATPTAAHFSSFNEILSNWSPRVILCEKPLSYSLIEAEEMVYKASKSGVSLFTNYMRRCDHSVIEIREKIESDLIEAPFKGVCWYSKGLINNGSHFINLLEYWLGEVKDIKVISSGRKINSKDFEPDVEIYFELGVIIFLGIKYENYSHNSLEIFSKNSRIRYDQTGLYWHDISSQTDLNENLKISDIPKFYPASSRLQWEVMEQISNFISNKKTTICTGSQGLRTLKVIDKINSELRGA